MAALLTFRDEIKNFCSRYDRVVVPLVKFILSLLMYWSIVRLTGGYNETVSGGLVIFLLSVVGAFVGYGLTYALGGVVALVNYLSVNTEIAVSFIVVFLVMYCIYIKFFPKLTWLIMYTPLLFMINMQYILPILAGMFAGPAGMVAMAIGAVFYYFSLNASDYIAELAAAAEETDMVESYRYIFQNLIENKEMILTIVVFAVVLLITYLIYRLSVDYAWYAAVVVGGLFEIILFLVGNVALEASISVGEILLGSVVAIVVGIIVQFFKTVVDYSRVENTQFEDDEYYYYVKAVPKITMAKQQKNVRKINTVVQEPSEDNPIGGVTR